METRDNVKATTPDDQEKPERKSRARAIVKNHVFWSLGVGLIPIPMADIFALSTFQLKMLAELADIYHVSYTPQSAKMVITSLTGSTASSLLAMGSASSIKAIPIIGQTAGIALMSIYGGAMTYAIGEVFIRHFETGGTFLNFDAEKYKDTFVKMYSEGTAKVKGWRHKKTEPAPETKDEPAAETKDEPAAEAKDEPAAEGQARRKPHNK